MTLRITRRQPDDSVADSGDFLRLAQAPWLEPPDGGFLEWMNDNDKGLSLVSLQEYWSTYKSFCGDDQSLEIEIYVYRNKVDLPYSINASYGELAEGAVGEASRTVYENIQEGNSLDLGVDVNGMVAAAWEGDVFDASGSTVTPPTITANGGQLSWDGEVIGTVKAQFNEVRTVHILTISPRDAADIDPEDPESAYASTVRAFWAGGVEELEVELPDMSGNCGGGSEAVVDDGDDEGCVRKTYVVDPCTFEVKSTRTESIPCPEED